LLMFLPNLSFLLSLFIFVQASCGNSTFTLRGYIIRNTLLNYKIQI
jgi:hypothetical protein